ncbi:hypothetical protein ACJRO7_004384 [Eucalyptus globulus]|uniref:Uncharacterized protein n=1 Tax=Eucalyptus globulus TaxID=34317 RepID=A0ABD3IYP5_EUCGL
MKNMIPPLLLLFLFISVLLEALTVSVTGDNVDAYLPVNSIAVNCGSLGNSSVANRSSPPVHNRIPHDTARLSRSGFVYSFRVTMGPKFVRLHFFPSDYLNFGHANSFFSVKAAGYTHLRNFSTLLFSDHTCFTSFCKESCCTIVADRILNVTFAFTPDNPDACAFVNGIEVISKVLRFCDVTKCKTS